VLAGAPRPVIVHTYHGHVLEGYFGRVRNGLYRAVERRLGDATDALVGVSPATVDDLVRLRIARRERFRVIPIGLNLEPFLSATPADGAAFRAEAGAGREHILLTFVGRLAPIKRVDVLLRAFRVALDTGAPVRLAVVGDGRLRADLEGLTHRLGVQDRVAFAGYRADMVAVAAAADVAVLTSDNEGTPVSLIEAGAAGNPAVSTRAGGVGSVVTADSGLVVDTGDHQAMGHAISELARDGARRHDMGRAARAHVAAHFSQDRLVADIDSLYSELLAGSRVTVGGGAPIDSPLRERTELA
jgi:glycosyltransferase involved in cell wall biosynthesis